MDVGGAGKSAKGLNYLLAFRQATQKLSSREDTRRQYCGEACEERGRGWAIIASRCSTWPFRLFRNLDELRATHWTFRAIDSAVTSKQQRNGVIPRLASIVAVGSLWT